MAIILWSVLAFGILLGALLAWKGGRTLHECFYPELYNSEDFPEARFPVRERAVFKTKAARGYAQAKRSTVVICGIARDDAETLPLTIRRIEKTGQLFADYRVVIFENDSRDETPALLNGWATANPRVTILTETLQFLPVASLGRFERLAYCRNRYLDYLDRTPALSGCDYIMVVDMDLGGGWSYDGIASTLAEAGWDAVAANSIAYHNLRKTYYDTLALDPPSTLQRTWFCRLFGEGWQLRKGGALIPVHSAFGGLCFYTFEALRSRRYAGTRDGVAVCEHHALNADGRLRFFLNPSQITVMGTQLAKNYAAEQPWKRRLYRLFRNW